MEPVRDKVPFTHLPFDNNRMGLSDMEKQFLKINDSLTRMAEMQECHMDSFNTTLLPDLEQQNSERDRELTLFKTDIDIFIKKAEAVDSPTKEQMITHITDRIASIIEQNYRLKQKIKIYRDELQSRMVQITKGKKAIGSYGISVSYGNRPRVINSIN